MATPQSTTSFQGESEDKKLEQITFRFCSECSNMLYPKEDEEAHKLQYTCRTCQYTEDARSTCVFRNIFNNSAGETAGVTQDVGSDPTVSEHDCALPVCLHCGMSIMCDTCGASSLEIEASMERCRGSKDMDFIMAFASNIPWTEEDLFDEFGCDFSADSAESTDSTSITSEASSARL
ncbi:hypothetical protein LLEC1_03207 [Akanthomyces lecanii]|uniref:DNA-directed RNA polymerase II subunit RPB9-like zinc ribbon domain-containing protein n=1 Tax=Cordyceps confragosa TaxID=2714763 RepID=A0A179II88_CORDF|nr:hypothetical protein LLEC1_03207 [Akanthomyces lecanii]